MRPLSSDLREFIHLLNTNSAKYVIVGEPAHAVQRCKRRSPDSLRCGQMLYAKSRLKG